MEAKKKKEYKKITIANALQVVSTTIFSILFGILKFDNGMIWGLIIGVLHLVLFIFYRKKLIKTIIRQKDIKSVAKEYYSFPRYMIFLIFL